MPCRTLFWLQLPLVVSTVAWGGCARDAADFERCPEGEIATVRGCRAVPSPLPDPGPNLEAPDAGKSSPSEQNLPDATVGPPEMDAGVLEDLDATTPALDLTGDWALRAQLSEVVTTAGSQPRSGTTVLHGHLRARATDGALALELRLCDMEVPEEDDYRVEYPSSAISAMSRANTAAALPGAVGEAFEPGPVAILLGFAPMGDPVSETFPTTSNDPRVVDSDNDRRPGASLNVETGGFFGSRSGALYAAARTVLTLQGTVTSPNRLEGNVVASRQELRFGTSNNQIPPRGVAIAPGAQPSSFALVRLPASEEDACARVRDLPADSY